MIVNKDIGELFIRNYVQYAKMTIQARAIPDARDGMKPVQRRILYSMHDNGMYAFDKNGKAGKAYKSTRIVGDVMGKYHPHGDMSIYGSLVDLTDDKGVTLAPYVHGDGTFGRVWSDKIVAASSRYTEANLLPIARDLFDGLNEDAVDMSPNFDNSEEEPTLLPVTFPTILVGSTDGIAVGFSSSVPRFSLKSVCNTAIGMLNGKYNKAEDILAVLGLPDFSTGGFIHRNDAELLRLLKTGRGSFTVSGTVTVLRDKIIVTEVPVGTTVEKIDEKIRELIAEGRVLKGVRDVINSSGFDTVKNEAKLGLTIELKNGADADRTLAELCRYTPIRTRVSFTTRVLLGEGCKEGRPTELGVYELLSKWLEWRQGTVIRQYSYKLEKEKRNEYLLSSWEKISSRCSEFVQDVATNDEDKLFILCEEKYGLTKEQTEYLIEKKIRSITQDKVASALAQLKKSREDMSYYERVVTDEGERTKLIVSQLERVRDTYGIERKCAVADAVVESEIDERLAEVVQDCDVSVVVTRSGLAKRFMNPSDSEGADSLLVSKDDEVRWKIDCNNRDTLLVFTTTGVCYKVAVHDIDNSSRTRIKNSLWNIATKKEDGGILYVTNAGDYSGGFTVIYGDGKAMYVTLCPVNGKRSKYINVFMDITAHNGGIVTEHEKFFVTTKRNYAKLVDLTGLSSLDRRSKFRVASLTKGDNIVKLVPSDKVANFDSMDWSPYCKPYAVKIKSYLPIL